MLKRQPSKRFATAWNTLGGNRTFLCSAAAATRSPVHHQREAAGRAVASTRADRPKMAISGKNLKPQFVVIPRLGFSW